MQTNTRKLLLPPPSVSEAIGDALSPTARMATVVVPTGANLAAHDLLIIKWEGLAGTGTVITFPLVVGDAAGKPYSYVIGAAAIAANAERTITVGYEVRRGGSQVQDVSDLYLLAITSVVEPEPLYVDPSMLTLSSTAAVQGHQASGGEPPYSYTSSAAAVAKVTDPVNGIVQAAANGTAVITVRDSATPASSAEYPITVTLPASEWDHEYDFDNDRLRELTPAAGQIFFPESRGTMSLQFDPDNAYPPGERLGVESYPFEPTAEFSGKNLYIGYPPDTDHKNYVFVNFDQSWDIVRFAVTSANREVTISFKDADLNILGDIQSIGEGSAIRQTIVIYDDKGLGRIRHMEIRSIDVIRLDSFKFKRRRT